MATVRGYEPRDLEACRGLWVELTQWHRDIFDAPEIGGDDPGRAFDEHLAKVGAENIWVAEVDGQVVGLAGLIPDVRRARARRRRQAASRTTESAGCSRKRSSRRLVRAVRERSRFARSPATSRPIRFFHELGFDVLDQLQLSMDLVDRERDPWIPGERLADRDFRF